MKWSQHRLNANKHLIRFWTVVWALCTTDRCVYDRSHCLLSLLLLLLVYARFVVHSVSIIFALALVWLNSLQYLLYSMGIDTTLVHQILRLSLSGVCVYESYGCGCCWYCCPCVFRVTALTCVRLLLLFCRTHS